MSRDSKFWKKLGERSVGKSQKREHKVRDVRYSPTLPSAHEGHSSTTVAVPVAVEPSSFVAVMVMVCACQLEDVRQKKYNE